MNEIIKTGLYRIVTIDSHPTDVCVLSDQQLLVADYIDEHLAIYDSDFKLIRKIREINESSIKPLSLATNRIDKIYVLDYKNEKILSTDYNFKLLGFIQNTSLCNPDGMFYYQNFLYICDITGKSIKKFDANLVLEDELRLDFKPLNIQIANSNLACIRPYELDGIYFYDIEKFCLKLKYNHSNGSIGVIKHENFYKFVFLKKKLYCFNKNGDFCESIVLDIDSDDELIEFEGTECVLDFHGNFIITSEKSRKLVVF